MNANNFRRIKCFNQKAFVRRENSLGFANMSECGNLHAIKLLRSTNFPETKSIARKPFPSYGIGWFFCVGVLTWAKNNEEHKEKTIDRIVSATSAYIEYLLSGLWPARYLTMSFTFLYLSWKTSRKSRTRANNDPEIRKMQRFLWHFFPLLFAPSKQISNHQLFCSSLDWHCLPFLLHSRNLFSWCEQIMNWINGLA